jgi:hypothetical protein
MIGRHSLFERSVAEQFVLLEVFAAHITKTLATFIRSLVSSEFQQPARQRRAALLQTSVVELRGAMTPAGWAALHTYINEKYRRSIVRQELKRDK